MRHGRARPAGVLQNRAAVCSQSLLIIGAPGFRLSLALSRHALCAAERKMVHAEPMTETHHGSINLLSGMPLSVKI